MKPLPRKFKFNILRKKFLEEKSKTLMFFNLIKKKVKALS